MLVRLPLIACTFCAILLTVGLADPAHAQGVTEPGSTITRIPGLNEGVSDISGDPNKPRRHFRVRNPAHLDSGEAARIYQGLVDDMVAAYGIAGQEDYRRWRRYNTAPYLSSTHGQRYINHYANERARAYGRYERAGRMPVGAIIAKDSFSVTEDGAINPGPLFLMEKMAAGFNYVSGDWRYSMIMPDGSVFGSTKGDNAEGVEYCVGCHLAVEHQDHLYFPPPEFRVKF